MSVVERIKARTVIQEDGCHVFQGALDRGYGRIGVGRQTHYTHRLMYESVKGPVPTGLHIDHLCRNRSCCNPEHLEAVTQAENNRRAALALDYKGIRGVYPCTHSAIHPWRAQVWEDGKSVHLGLFATYEEAAIARLRAQAKTADPERRKTIEAEVAKLTGKTQQQPDDVSQNDPALDVQGGAA